MTISTCVFDAYGTLFDVAAAAREAGAEPGRDKFGAVWQKVANDWRLKQLQYTWLRAVAGAHTDFWEVTQNGLDWALEASGLDDPELRERLLSLYWELSAYDEVPVMLAQLKVEGFSTAILSNEKYRGIRLIIRSGAVVLQAHNPEQEEAEEELEVSYTGDDIEIGFNVNYLLDAIGAVDSEDVALSVVDSNSSCLIRQPGSDDCKFVVMPMRL